MVIFNRPETTRQVFETVRKMNPEKLFVIADGPRKDHPDDFAKCKETRSIIDGVDWPCEVYRKYSDDNLGCCKNPWMGFKWVFSQTERAIVLEDDIIADPSFFQFCDDMLERYADNPRVMSINGTNYAGHTQCDTSYFFSRYIIPWGWASWSRTWEHYDIDMKRWADPEVQKSVKARLTSSQFMVKNAMYSHYMNQGDHSTVWDLQYEFSILSNDGLVVVPKDNLVTNIGFGEDATHTSKSSENDTIQSNTMHFPLIHPDLLEPNEQFDSLLYQKLYNGSRITQLKRMVKSVLKMKF